MSQSQDRFVLPGDVIVTGTYRPEQNVVLDDDRVTAKLHHTYHFHGKLTSILSVFLYSQHLIYLEKIIHHLKMNFPQN
jgi:exosome complex RNA-binding protein Rrp4